MTTGAAPGRRAPPCTSRSGARRSRAKALPHRRRMPAARRRLLSFRLVPVRARRSRRCGPRIKRRSNAGRRRCRISRRRASACEIPYQGKTLAGILRKPAGAVRPPVVVMAVGLDSTKEETDAYEAPFLARGMATLVFEGPGQGEAQYDFRHPRRLRGAGEGGARLRRDAARSRCRAHRHVGRQPRRLLRAARRRLRQAHQGLHARWAGRSTGARPGTACRN